MLDSSSLESYKARDGDNESMPGLDDSQGDYPAEFSELRD
jgi:hypothetical protein